ncbi:hypothetical protein EGK75_01960 [Neisseria weixii]|uniref:Uncharacterized protein n=1 Tax=Neisseria weixii TaxID=1853276 RepID=A0A3N4N1Y6_9NEIS|nr:hypothetical protein [Neisseria weixii]RPD90192.1 hypothetical protein EGK74_02560 [Neisseria weixii]RPD90236.1 hypothetical protein EGK75_01960 [Neisseria weixii]
MEKEHDKDKPAGSRRMEILQQSLADKQAAFDERLQAHFDDVKSANGQPLNDKRNGQATMNRWERQNDGLRSMQESIEKTQRAIEREQYKIDKVAGTKIPEYLKPLLESGEISQWRKYPNRFFVKGVEKARIIWFEDKQEFGYSHIQGIPPEQRLLFKETYGKIRALHRQENSLEPVKPAGSRMEILQQSPADKQAANTDSPSENLKANGYGSFLPLPDFGLQGQDLKAFKASWLRAVESLPAAIEKQRERLAAAGIDDTGLTEYGRETDSGKRSGITTEMTQQRLADITRYIERLRDGQIKPSDYIGSGYKNPRQTAFEAMARDMVETQAVLSPHIPYYDDINVNNYLRRQLEAEREPQRPSEKHYSEKIIDRLAERHGWTKKPDPTQLPPENVLAEYPELSALYMPKSLSERLQTAKQEYERLLAGGNDTDRKLGRFMESGMEALAKGLPEQTQLQVRVNFYENLISRINGKGEPERTPEQQELFAER